MNTRRPRLSKTALATAAIALAGLSTHAQAQSVSLIDIESVCIPKDGYASIGYAYYVGKYEVTNAQYAVFLNAVASDPSTPIYQLWNSNAEINRVDNGGYFTYEAVAGKENHPVRYVSLLDAKRFCNWLTSFKTGGSEMETGAYSNIPPSVANYLGTYSPGSGGTKDPDVPVARAPRDDGAWQGGAVALLTTAEWEKAAFFDPNKEGGPGWWNYATTAARRQNDPNALDESSSEWANCGNFYGGTTAVDLFEQYPSAYGVVDMTGNLFEWTDSFRVSGTNNHFVRGGMHSTTVGDKNLRRDGDQYTQFYDLSGNNGFRVASLEELPKIFPVPEPSTYALIGGIGAVALAVGARWRRRRKG